METSGHGGVEYDKVGQDYFDNRQLKRGAAGWLLLVGLGVAYVISGDYAGCLRSMFRAVRADVPLLASRRTCAMAVKSLVHLAFGDGSAATTALRVSHAGASRPFLPPLATIPRESRFKRL